ncbi:DUF4360 domain-containing protein [Actinomadura fulvescens]|uniref:DUF4360 domain-containing protein n=1 Tax=Actinomadura fulvescens TaxID=46160 RepID=A0ABP6DAQ4_9ACTN
MRARVNVTAAVVVMATAGVVAPASADSPPGQITVEVVTVNGSGCPAGTARVTPLPGNAGFTVSYSDYLARTGGSSDPVDSRKNCQLNLAIHIPQGFTYAIASAQYQGFAHLQAGADGLQRANYYFQGSPENHPVSHTIRGPYSDEWRFTDTTDVAALVYKPCGEDRNLNINTELRVNRGGSDAAKTSFMTMDSTRGGIKTIYHFSWKKCP